MSNDNFVPALGFHWLTHPYDHVVSLSMREKTLKQRLVVQAPIAFLHDVLDVGCGTGTLALIAKRNRPQARVVGLDGDPAVLAIARRKITAAGASIERREGLANTASAFPPASFDRILTSLALHHLTTEQNASALRTMHTWLRPGGELHVLDFGPQANSVLRLLSRGVGWLDGADRLRDNWEERLPELMNEAGFVRASETCRAPTLFGSVSFYSAG